MLAIRCRVVNTFFACGRCEYARLEGGGAPPFRVSRFNSRRTRCGTSYSKWQFKIARRLVSQEKTSTYARVVVRGFVSYRGKVRCLVGWVALEYLHRHTIANVDLDIRAFAVSFRNRIATWSPTLARSTMIIREFEPMDRAVFDDPFYAHWLSMTSHTNDPSFAATIERHETDSLKNIDLGLGRSPTGTRSTTGSTWPSTCSTGLDGPNVRLVLDPQRRVDNRSDVGGSPARARLRGV